MRLLFRRSFLTGSAATFLSVALWGADPVLDFVHVSDTHVTNLKEVHPAIAASLQHRRETAARLPKVLQRLSGAPAPAFILITGDLVDGYSYDGAAGRPVYG